MVCDGVSCVGGFCFRSGPTIKEEHICEDDYRKPEVTAICGVQFYSNCTAGTVPRSSVCSKCLERADDKGLLIEACGGR
jgi:hypothetical protein